jgi:hypothetical protein
VIYGKPRQQECAAVAEGLSALGTAVSWRSAAYADPQDDYFDDVDLAVTFGQRLWSAAMARAYRDNGVPVVTVDLPPLRLNGYPHSHRAVWLNHVNWMPAEPCPPDRLDRMHLRFNERRDPGSAGVLVCGQTEDDAAHGMGAVALREWARSTCVAAGDFYPVTWRPHPRCQFTVGGFQMSKPEEPIEEVLRRDWRAVVTFNSTVGLSTILAGLPVFCAPTCFYSELANVSLAGLPVPGFPDIGQLVRFFSRLAYVQWSFDEISSGEALAFILPLARKEAL